MIYILAFWGFLYAIQNFRGFLGFMGFLTIGFVIIYITTPSETMKRTILEMFYLDKLKELIDKARE
jgi:hypothetical protein